MEPQQIRDLLNRIEKVFRSIWEALKERFEPLVDYVMELYRQKPKQDPVFNGSWSFQQRRHDHQSRQILKLQEQRMRSWDRPWKAWKAQRR
jgi:hypothetical protein